MKKRLREIFFVAAPVLAGWIAVAGLNLAHASESVRLETFKTHSRLSFRLDEGVSAEWKSSKQGFELFLKGIGFSDLGAPLGEENQWLSRFKGLKDPRLGELTFAEVAGGLKIQGQWKYAEGAEAPANPLMEAFDYREKTTSEFVVDFWVKEGPSLGQIKSRRDAARRIASLKRKEEEARARAARRLAREKARVKAEDPAQFCHLPLNEDSDVFLQFYSVHEKVAFERWFEPSAPDASFAYYEPKSKAKDAQYVRLALKLYNEKQYALVTRTLDFLDQEHPESEFRPEMRFLRANAMLKLGLVDEANRQLKDLMYEPRSTSSSLHAAMYLAHQQMAKNDNLGALESFLWMSAHHAENRMAWIFHMGAAENARVLKQTERAAKEYQWVAEHAPTRAFQAEGALRMGDLYMERFQFDQGLAAYAQAARHYKDEADRFPSLQINRAEALYGLGQYERAAQGFRDFLERFSTHPAGWRAAYRLGEIEARKTDLDRASSTARGWYLETINRFPFSPGATLARLQLIPCGDHAGFNADAAKRFFETEAATFDGAGEIAMERFKDFRALSHVRSLMALGQQEAAVATAIEELKRVPGEEARHWLGGLLAMNFRKSVMAMLDKGQKIEALTFYQQKGESIPRQDSRVDPDYLLKLSLAASDLGLGKLAQEINSEFEKFRKLAAGSDRALASGSEGNEKQQDLEDPQYRMDRSERAFTEAKALWISSGLKEEARIRAALAKVGEESSYSDEREIILGLIEQAHGRSAAALRHAAQAQLLSDEHDPRIDAWVASLEARAGDSKAALVAYRHLENQKSAGKTHGAPTAAGIAEKLGVPSVPGREELILAQSEILEKQSHWGEAAANYSRAVEGGLGGSQALYGYARALLKSGGKENRAKAFATLEKLAALDVAVASPSSAPAAAEAAPSGAPGAKTASKVKVPSSQDRFWRKLASETLANEKTAEKTSEAARSRNTD